MSPDAKIIALAGSRDDNTLPALAKSYVEALRARGVDASYELIPNETHNGVIRSSAVFEAIGKTIAK